MTRTYAAVLLQCSDPLSAWVLTTDGKNLQHSVPRGQAARGDGDVPVEGGWLDPEERTCPSSTTTKWHCGRAGPQDPSVPLIGDPRWNDSYVAT